MKNELIKSGHAVGESNFHLQLTPAYRQDIFWDEQVAELTLAYILEKLHELKVVIKGYGFGLDHLHLFVSNVRFVSEVELVRQVKGTPIICPKCKTPYWKTERKNKNNKEAEKK